MSLTLIAVSCGAPEPASPPEAPGSRAAAGRREAVPGEPADLVRIHLLADVTRVAPGAELSLALRFDIQPGWHIYWLNPGESGLATEAVFRAPPGFTVGPVRHPGPVRFESPGDLVSYGYSEHAVLSAQVRPPDGMGDPDDPVRFSVESTWLACRDVCIRGQGVADVELPVATRAEPPRPANQDLFRAHREELPRPFAELGASQRWERDAGEVRLAIEVRGAERIEYFPPVGEDLALSAQAFAGGVLRLVYKPATKPARTRGVLAVTASDRRRYYAVDLTEGRTETRTER